MAKKRTFISFDYDNDVDLKNALVGQSRLSDSPFDITDISIKEAMQSCSLSNYRVMVNATVQSRLCEESCGRHFRWLWTMMSSSRIHSDLSLPEWL